MKICQHGNATRNKCHERKHILPFHVSGCKYFGCLMALQALNTHVSSCAWVVQAFNIVTKNKRYDIMEFLHKYGVKASEDISASIA